MLEFMRPLTTMDNVSDCTKVGEGEGMAAHLAAASLQMAATIPSATVPRAKDRSAIHSSKPWQTLSCPSEGRNLRPSPELYSDPLDPRSASLSISIGGTLRLCGQLFACLYRCLRPSIPTRQEAVWPLLAFIFRRA